MKFLIPNLTILEVNRAIVKTASEIRRTYGFRLADAVQLATAVHEKADVFITNDQRLKHFKPLRVIPLSSL
jgi:predicted nucleic acid-binding protein